MRCDAKASSCLGKEEISADDLECVSLWRYNDEKIVSLLGVDRGSSNFDNWPNWMI
jgi:hypothetical protein